MDLDAMDPAELAQDLGTLPGFASFVSLEAVPHYCAIAHDQSKRVEGHG